ARRLVDVVGVLQRVVRREHLRVGVRRRAARSAGQDRGVHEYDRLAGGRRIGAACHRRHRRTDKSGRRPGAGLAGVRRRRRAADRWHDDGETKAASRTSARVMTRLPFAILGLTVMVSILPAAQGTFDANRAAPQLESELVFPLEHWHNHASMIVEAPNGDLLVCWFHGSGERTADDVVIRGARLRKGAKTWSEPFLLADTPGYPDTNATMFIDPRQRLWLLWPT